MVYVRAFVTRLRDRGFIFFLQFRCQATTLGKLFTRIPQLPSSVGTGQGAVMPCGSAAAQVTIDLTSHWPCVTNRPLCFIYIRAQDLRLRWASCPRSSRRWHFLRGPHTMRKRHKTVKCLPVSLSVLSIDSNSSGRRVCC